MLGGVFGVPAKLSASALGVEAEGIGWLEAAWLATFAGPAAGGGIAAG